MMHRQAAFGEAIAKEICGGNERVVHCAVGAALFVGFALNTLSIVNVMASVDVVARLENTENSTGHTFDVAPEGTVLKAFGFGEMVRDFWDADAYIMVALTILGACLIFTGRAAALIVIWTSRRVSARRRGIVLRMFECVTSLVFTDVLFFCYLGTVLTMKFDVVPVSFVPMRIEVETYFRPTVYIMMNVATNFLLAVMGGNVMLHLHTRFMREQTPTKRRRSVPSPLRPLLRSEKDVVGSMRRPDRIPRYRYGLLLLVTVTTYACAISAPLVDVRFGGVAGELLRVVERVEEKSSNSPVHRTFYPLRVGADILSATWTRTPVAGVVFASVSYLLVLVAPCVFLLAAATRLLCDNTARVKGRVGAIMRIAFAWSGLDVVFVSTLALCLELNMVVQFIVKQSFEDVCETLSETANDETCVHVSVVPRWGLFVVLAAAIQMYAAYAFALYYEE
eukprot:g1153.t1